MATWVKELEGAGADALPMDAAVRKLRDEITGVAMARHRGSNRELAFAMAKLDEAELWLQRYFINSGSHVLIDKRRFATDTTQETGSYVS